MSYDIKVGSITNAQKVKKALVAGGFKANFHRIDNPTPKDGCGYAVMTNGDKSKILKIINNTGVNILGVVDI